VVAAGPRRRFIAYDDSIGVPNIVVDGSPNRSTVLTLTHWPGIAQPAGLGADLSAQMAFAYLERPPVHEPAEVVTNNHFDQDGLVSVLALTQPDLARRHRDVLIDVAAAGDFATYRHRVAARASMAIWAYAHAEASPIADRLAGRPYPEQCALLYEEVLPLLVPMVTEPDRFRRLWASEDAELTASQRAVASGAVTIEERPELDLAVVSIDEGQRRRGGHRFASDSFAEIHPMAIHNATDRFRLLFVHGRRFRFVDRYETWVQYRSRRPRPRVDLRPLADHLTELETGATAWAATAPSELTPTLAPDAESSLGPDVVIAAVVRHLGSSGGAWDPYEAAC
jgi:hypothetical protein